MAIVLQYDPSYDDFSCFDHVYLVPVSISYIWPSQPFLAVLRRYLVGLGVNAPFPSWTLALLTLELILFLVRLGALASSNKAE